MFNVTLECLGMGFRKYAQSLVVSRMFRKNRWPYRKRVAHRYFAFSFNFHVTVSNVARECLGCREDFLCVQCYHHGFDLA